MTEPIRKTLLFCMILILGVGILFGIENINYMFFTTNKNIEQGSNWDTKEIPGLNGVEIGMSYDDVNGIELDNCNPLHIIEHDIDDTVEKKYKYKKTGENAYTKDLYFHVKIDSSVGDVSLADVNRNYSFSEDTLIDVRICSHDKYAYDYYYDAIVDAFGEHHKESGVLYGSKDMLWETGNLYITVSPPDPDFWDISFYDIRYSPEKVKIIE